MSLYPQALLDLHEELIVDCFAGGGGASSGIEQAFGRMVDIAINHDPKALSMHQANHPQTWHIQSDIFEVDPRKVTQGRPVGLAWFSPDCTDHSKAKGGKPIRTTKRRSLAWVVTRWAGTVRPRVICLENVEEFKEWSPLIGRPGQFRRCPKRKGLRFRQWVRSLTKLGYKVEWRELRSCDYGAPTIRKRLYLIARCDGKPIVWPDTTHSGIFSEVVTAEWGVIALKDAIKDAKTEDRPGLRKLLKAKEAHLDSLRTRLAKTPRPKAWRTIAECIDWSLPMASIFLTRAEAAAWGKENHLPRPVRPLAENTMKRIARGVKRFVLDNPKPFLVTLAHGEESNGVKRWGKTEHDLSQPHRTVKCSNDTAVVAPVVTSVANSKTTGRGPNNWTPEEPLRTITSTNPFGVIAPIIAPITHAGERNTPPADEPLATITTANRGEQAVVAPMLVPRYGEREGQEPRVRSVEDPAPVIVPDGNGGSLAAVHMTSFRTGATGHDLDEPAKTITSNAHQEGTHPGGCAPMGVVAANLISYHTEREGEEARAADPANPVQTLDCANRIGLIASFLGQHNGGFAEGNSGDGHSAEDPISTISTKGPHQSVIAANMIELHGTAHAEDIEEPLQTISAGGTHHAVAATHIQRDFGMSVGSPSDAPIGTVTGTGNGKAGLVAAFLAKYYGQGTGQEVTDPIHTIPPVEHFGFVTVKIGDETYFIEDICMRMLAPKELYLAQGFRPGYIFDRDADGNPLTKTEQVRMCGNSVSPPVAEAIARANCPELIVRQKSGRAA